MRLAHLLHAVSPQANDLTRTHVLLNLIIQVGQAARLAGSRESALLLANHDRRTPPFITSHDNAILGQQQHRARALDLFIHVLNTLHEVLALRNQQSDQLRLIGLARAQLREVHVSRKQFLLQLIDVIDFRYRDNGELTQMRIDHDRLRIRIADDTYTGVALELT